MIVRTPHSKKKIQRAESAHFSAENFAEDPDQESNAEADDSLREAGNASTDEAANIGATSELQTDRLSFLQNQAPMSNIQRLRQNVWSFLEEPETKSASLFFQFRALLYFTSAVLPLCGQTTDVGQLAAFGSPLDEAFNIILVFEVVLRLIVCPSASRFLADPYHNFDIIACLPFVVRLACIGSVNEACLATPGGFYQFVGHLRPLLRMLKVTRHVGGFTLLFEVLRRSMEGLGVPAFLVCLLISFFASTIHWAEMNEQSFQSLPEVVWFCVVTISTVGYGDVSPTSAGGRLLGVFLILMGLVAFAMPLGVISGNFSAVYEDKDEILLLRKVLRRLNSSGIGPDRIIDQLKAIDTSGDGKLDFMEFSTLLKSFNVGFSDENSRQLFDFVDEDKSGTLDYTEFLEKVFPDYRNNPNCRLPTSPAAILKGPVELDDILGCVNDVQGRLQKLGRSLDQLSSSTASRLSALEMRCASVDSAGELQAEKSSVKSPDDAITPGFPAYFVKVTSADGEDADLVQPLPHPFTEGPNSSSEVQKDAEGGWLEADMAAGSKGYPKPATPIPLELVTDAEVLPFNEVQKLVDEELDEDRPQQVSKPVHTNANPQAPSTPAPTLPGCYEGEEN